MNIPQLTALRGLILAAAAAAVASCSASGDGRLPGTLERDRLELVADAAETIIEMPVREGARVAQNALILALDGSVAVTQLEGARAQVAAAQARLDELRNGPRATTIGAAVARRDRARTVRDNEARERERLRGLIAQNLVSRAALDQQTAVAASSEDGLREAEAVLRELQQGTRKEQIDQARRAVEQSAAQLRQLETTKSRLEVRAPREAIVDALPFRVGEKPARGATVVVLLATGAPFARVHVPEPLRARVRVGTAARIRVDGVKDEFSGKVRYIATDPEFTPYYSLTESDRSRLAYRAEIVIDSAAAAELPAGLPLEVMLQLDAAP
jgi:HlyD family secretion protein